MDSLKELENIFNQYWKNEKSYVVMPNTIRARSYLAVITKDIKIETILDNDYAMSQTFYRNIPIAYAPNYLSENGKKKILVSSHYAEVAEQLKEAGYEENIDFIDMHLFVSIWYWSRKEEIHFLDVHTSITTYCSLNCSNCNMFMNHYKKEQKRTICLQEFQENFTMLFKSVDYCYKITILGGEPFLNKELPQMLEWLFETYNKKIGEIVIVTNGTIVPQKSMLDILHKVNAKVNISDYHIGTAYDEKIKEVELALKERGIVYKRNKEKIWKNFYFPREQQGACFSSIREHMLCCNPSFRGLNDKKFYYCHIVWSAVQAGLLKEEKADSIELGKIHTRADRQKLLEHDLGFVERGYISLCKACGGCGKDNTNIIVAGVQE